MKGVRFDRQKNKWEMICFFDGQRIRKYYDTQKDANAARTLLEKNKLKGGKQAVEWNENAFREWKFAKEMLHGDDLIEAVSYYVRTKKAIKTFTLVEDAVREFISEKENANRSVFHITDLKTRLTVFCKKHGLLPCHEIETGEILSFLKNKERSARTIKNYLNILSSFFAWTVRKRYCAKNPCMDIHESDLPTVRASEIGILTPDELKILFESAKERSLICRRGKKDWTSWIALQAFLGLRVNEALLFKVEYIDFENRKIVLPSQIVKTKDTWLIDDIPDIFWNIVNRKHIDIPGEKQMFEIRDVWERKTGKEFPRNALRHSFATYHLSLHRNAPRTSLVMRHRNPNQLWQSYLAKLVSEQQASKWFEK